VADVVWIQYSDLTTDIEVGRNLLTNSLTSEDISYKINNKWDFHTGAEFVVFVGKVPAALRIGYYHKGSSSLIVDATPGLGSSGTELFHRLYPERPAEHHFTMGNGFVFGDHFQIDWALDLANISDSFVLSSVVRF
jgi:hypothetical protein